MFTYTTTGPATTVTMFVRQADNSQATSNASSTPSSTSTPAVDPLAVAIGQSAYYRTCLVGVSLVLAFLVLGLIGYFLYPVYKRVRARKQIQETRQWPSAATVAAPQVVPRAPSRAASEADDGFEMASVSTKSSRPDAAWFSKKRAGGYGEQMI
ncbi:hypothetical protein LTR86_004592 [Recurvomyces mirabilis]|nr:hypothetical protein LTR86_004592 [Recurvomyces mirabilis]